MRSHLFKKPRMVGIAIHEDEIRLLCLSKAKNIAMIEHYVVRKVRPEWVVGGRFHNSEKIADVIKGFVEQEGLDQSAAAIAFPMAQVVTKYISLPAYLSWAESKTEIRENLSYYLSASSDELYADVIQLGARSDKENEFLVIAARRAMIREYMTVVARSCLTLQVIDIDFYAITRAVGYVRCATPTYIVIDVDDSQAKMIFVCQHKIIHHQLCQAVSFCEQLLFALHRIKKTNDSFAGDTVFISGNQSRVASIKEAIQAKLAMNIEVIDPLHHVKLSSGVASETVHSSSILTVLGLALRQHDG